MSPMVSFSIRVSAMTDAPFCRFEERFGSICSKCFNDSTPSLSSPRCGGGKRWGLELLERFELLELYSRKLKTLLESFVDPFISAAERPRHQMFVRHKY